MAFRNRNTRVVRAPQGHNYFDSRLRTDLAARRPWILGENPHMDRLDHQFITLRKNSILARCDIGRSNDGSYGRLLLKFRFTPGL